MGFFCDFLGDFVQNSKVVRNQYQISKAVTSKTIFFSSIKWHSILDKKELKLNDGYYDVISVIDWGKIVAVKIVKDKFENESRIPFFNNIISCKVPIGKKKKGVFTKYITCEINSFSVFNKRETFQNFMIQFDQKTKSYIDLIQRPPC